MTKASICSATGLLFVCAAFLSPTFLGAQSNPMSDTRGHLGIGTTAPDPSALLDLTALDAGLLLPRTTPGAIPNPARGLMIYNTATDRIEINTGTSLVPVWDQVVTARNNPTWLLDGNTLTGSLPGSPNEFLGSINAADVVVRSNNTERLRIASTGEVGIGTAPATGDQLTVGGAVRFSGELKPNGAAGNSGEFLVSGGTGASPTWQSGIPFSSIGNGTNTGNANLEVGDGSVLAPTGTGVLRSNDFARSGSTSAAVDLNVAAEVNGTLPVGNGGTGLAAAANNVLLRGTGGAALAAIPAPTDSETVLKYNGTNIGWGPAIPQGFMISSTSRTAPTGYTYTGIMMRGDSDSWTSRAVMPTARHQFGMAVSDGRIYVIGGYNGAYLDVNERYDPAANTWTTRTAMPTARRSFSCTEANGKIYAIAGYNGAALDTNEVYDPIANTWAIKTSSPGGHGDGAALAFDGWIYLIGGNSDGVGTFSSISSVEAYDIANDTFAVINTNPFSYFWFGGTAGCILNGKAYLTGGLFNNPSALMEFDPTTRRMVEVTSLPAGRRHLGLTTLDGRIYAIGGMAAGTSIVTGTETPLATNQVYNLENDSWMTAASLPTARWGMAAATVNRRIYVIGGTDGTSSLDVNEMYKLTDKILYFFSKN